MTRDSALVQMSKGNKVTHEHFESREYLCKVHGIIITQDDHSFGKQFNERDYFSDGWTLYTEPKKP